MEIGHHKGMSRVLFTSVHDDPCYQWLGNSGCTGVQVRLIVREPPAGAEPEAATRIRKKRISVQICPNEPVGGSVGPPAPPCQPIDSGIGSHPKMIPGVGAQRVNEV